MKRPVVTWVASLTCLMALTVSARAQYYQTPPSYGAYGGPPQRYTRPPILSPYLNLLRGGDPAANYFLGVIPELQRRNDYVQLRSAIQEADARAAAAAATGTEALDLARPLDQTGHPVAFGYYGSYYPQQGRPGGAAAIGRPRP